MIVTRHDFKIIKALETASIYKKKGDVQAIVAKGGEKIKTVYLMEL